MDDIVDYMVNSVLEFFVTLIVGTIAGVVYLIQWAANRDKKA